MVCGIYKWLVRRARRTQSRHNSWRVSVDEKV